MNPCPEVVTTVLIDDEVENEVWWAAAAAHLATAPSWAEDFLCSRQELLELVDAEVAELRAWIASFYTIDLPIPILFSEPIDTEPNSRTAMADREYRSALAAFDEAATNFANRLVDSGDVLRAETIARQARAAREWRGSQPRFFSRQGPGRPTDRRRTRLGEQ